MTYGTLTAPAAGATLPIDDISGAKFPRTKMAFGAEGAATDVSAGAPLPVAPAASESYLGKVGGDVNQATVVPTVSTTPYTANDVIGSKMTFAAMARVNGGSGIIQSVVVNSKSAQTGAVDLLLFSADPSASTFTDNAGLATNAADFDKYIGVIHLTDWTNLGTPSLAQLHNVGLPFKAAGGATALYGVLVARSTPTLGSVSDLKVTVSSIPG